MDKSVQVIWSELGVDLKRFILKRVGDEPAAEDILQDVFVKIHSHLDSVQDDRKLTGWVYQIARNAIIDHYRSHHPTVPLEPDLPEAISEDTEFQLALNRSIRGMIDRLPEEYRLPLFLDTFEGCSQAEIARQLGISYAAAKSRIQRARAKLRDLLLECCHFEFDRRGSIIDYHPRAHCCTQCGCASNVTLSIP